MSIRANIYPNIACSNKNSKIESDTLHILKTEDIIKNLIKYVRL